ncbi:putative enzymatic protein [Pseudoalteromonas luteoviolacea B = ATCC 29581]|nr:putative enzymatic protein [Pseudoalteromonas luteoviolacea B = ATCC 29581]
MDVKAILFDFDGTLVDSEVLHYVSWMKVLEPYKVTYTELLFCDEFSGVPSLESAEILRQRHHLPFDAKTLTDLKNSYFVETAKRQAPTLMPGVLEVLSQLSDRFDLALVTGSSQAEAFPVLHYYGIDQFFKAIVTKDDVSAPKPAPEPYQMALTLLNCEAHHAVAVEDSATGLTSARDANVHCVVIPHQHSLNQDFSRANANLTNLFQCKDYIVNLAK